jgi:hypothetical protein
MMYGQNVVDSVVSGYLPPPEVNPKSKTLNPYFHFTVSGHVPQPEVNPESLTRNVEDSVEHWHHAVRMYEGGPVANALSAAQEYMSATILQLDIVDYTRTCSRTTPNEVAKWMSRVHMIIDQV